MKQLQLHTLLEQVARFQEEGKSLHAMQILRAILAEDPSCDKAYLQLAQLYMETNRSDLAEEVLLKGSAANKENLEYDFLLGTLHLRQAKFSEALAYFGNLKHLNIPQIHQSIGIIYLHQNNLQGAEEELRRAVVGDPELPDVHELLAEVFLRRGKHQDAQTVLQFALSRNPYSGHAHRLLGHLHVEKKEYDKAQAAFEQAIDCTPDDADAWGMCGRVLLLLNRYHEASVYLERACTLNPNDAAAWTALAQAFAGLGDVSKALEMIATALALQPDSREALQLKLSLSSSLE